MNITKLSVFCASNGVTAISNVRVNENAYPYLTLLSPKFEGGAQNIYFSKSCALKVSVGETPKALGLVDYNIVEVKNEAGEVRIKLTNTNNYTNVADLF